MIFPNDQGKRGKPAPSAEPCFGRLSNWSLPTPDVLYHRPPPAKKLLVESFL